MDACKHEKVTIYYKLVAAETRYEPAEYEEFAECDECGKRGDPSDFETEVTDEIEVDKYFHGSMFDTVEESRI